MSCAGPAWDEEFEDVDVVFVGLVTEKEQQTKEITVYTLQVKEIFKGQVDSTVQIHSDQSLWGIHLNKDWNYVIFGDHDGDYIKPGICTRSGPVPPVPSEHVGEKNYALYTKKMLDIVLMEQKPSPLKQVELGVSLTDIICNSDLVLVGKLDNTPSCVKLESIEKLVDRGWANFHSLRLIDDERVQEKYRQMIKEDSAINSFEDCVSAGYPVMESYPRQCRTDGGKHFVETIS